MSRAEFTKQTKRDAIKRASGRCEGLGVIFGLEPGKRCEAAIANGVRFEHIDPDANSKDNSLENCACVCLICWRYKTDHYDKPLVAKTTRQQDKANGIKRPKFKWPSRPFASRSVSNTKYIGEDIQ